MQRLPSGRWSRGCSISLLNSYNDMRDSDPVGLTCYVAAELSKRQVGYPT